MTETMCDICELSKNHTAEEIAQMTGKRKDTIRVYLNRHGIHQGRKSKMMMPKYSKEFIESAVNAIAKELADEIIKERVRV